MITVECQRVDCDANEEIEHWQGHKPVLFDLDEGEHVDIELPEGWGVDINGYDHVLHCPEHRS